MKWTDNSIKKDILFKELEIGEGFEKDEILYIKVGDISAFDVINDKNTLFDLSSIVTSRDCEIIFH